MFVQADALETLMQMLLSFGSTAMIWWVVDRAFVTKLKARVSSHRASSRSAGGQPSRSNAKLRPITGGHPVAVGR